MRMNSARVRFAMVILTLTAAVLLAGCPKHENFPTTLEVVEAPAPSTFEIISNGINTSGEYEYDLTWSISDGTNVDRYRLYLVGGGMVPELVHETDDQETAALALPVALPFNAEGLLFGLSTVSTGFVESAVVVDTIPPAAP